MKHLLKVMVILAAFFATTFIVANLTGFLNVEQIESWLLQAKKISPLFIACIVVILLFSDLFIAIPTMTVITLSGYFLGFLLGSISSFIGLLLAAVTGYVLSKIFGEQILKLVIKKETERKEAINTFREKGFIMILLSRAVPILPEVTACMAGMTKMRFSKFILAWTANTIPYVLIISYAGSVSSLQAPQPAIFTAIGISAVLWTCWFIFHGRRKKAETTQ